jgi:hypothetical protein
MPFNTDQLAYGAKSSIDFYMKNKPIDQVNIDRPLIKKLLANRRDWVGGLQYVIETLRIGNDSNFQSYFGDQQVTYNRKRTLDQAKFSWGSFHDGFGLNEDELTQNGIVMTDDRDSVPSDAERVQLVNILEENMDTLKLGFQENFDLMLHRDGTASSTDIPGLDAIIDMTPATGVVGGIDPATNTAWRNYANTSVATTAGAVVAAMETAWRATVRVGGSAPDFFLAGSDFFDAYRNDANNAINRQLTVNGKGGNTIDAGNTGVFFKGVEVVWDPVFDLLDTLDAPAIPWKKRLYMINTKHISLRPIKGHWMVNRTPPRVYDRYVHYFALTAKAALTTNRRNAHAVLALA